jgi:GT2 family glycosyltransferase
MILSILIVSWNTCQLLDKCLDSVEREIAQSTIGRDNVEVFVIDNFSGDGSADMVSSKHEWVKLIRNQANLGFAAANNQALKIAHGKFILLLNPDTEVLSGTLDTLINFFSDHPSAGVVAPQLLNSDGSIQRSCRAFPTFSGMFFELAGLSRLMPNVQRFRQYKMLDFDHNHAQQVDQPEGACLLIKKEVIEKVGILDEGFFMLFEEVDWCYRIKQAGFQIWFTPAAKIIHHYGQAIKQVKAQMIMSSHRGLYRFWFKHYRNGRWYLDGLAYGGLIGLAYLRIVSHWLKSRRVQGIEAVVQR